MYFIWVIAFRVWWLLKSNLPNCGSILNELSAHRTGFINDRVIYCQRRLHTCKCYLQVHWTGTQDTGQVSYMLWLPSGNTGQVSYMLWLSSGNRGQFSYMPGSTVHRTGFIHGMATVYRAVYIHARASAYKTGYLHGRATVYRTGFIMLWLPSDNTGQASYMPGLLYTG